MRRAPIAAVAVAAPLALSPLAMSSAGAAQPRIYHTIKDTTGSTVSTHTHVRDGNVASTNNGLRRPASATVSVQVADRSATGTAGDAVIERAKSRCIEVPPPSVEGFFPCFGFPG